MYSIKSLHPGGHKTDIDPEYFDFLKEVLENRMNVNPSDYYVVLNSVPIKNTKNIINFGKILLEDLGFKGFAMLNSASLSLFSTGRTSGIVMDCGELRSYVVPIYEVFIYIYNSRAFRYITLLIRTESEVEILRI